MSPRLRPLVSLKAGVTLDGRISSGFGESRWITGPEARAAGHALRGSHDAILVGSGTLLADDPGLDTRHGGGANAIPVVLDTLLRTPAGARVLTAGRRPLIFCGPLAPERKLPAEVVRVPEAMGGLDLEAVLQELHARGIRSVLVEGGGRVHRSFIEGDLADRIELFVAPFALAGGPGWVGGGPWNLDLAPRFAFLGVEAVGEDLHLRLGRKES